MTLANDILSFRMPNIEKYLAQGVVLDEYDEYGFTPLIEAAITQQPKTAELILKHGAKIDTPDSTGRTALFWATDNADSALVKLFLQHDADPNKYTAAGMPLLVNPLLRSQTNIKQQLYNKGANVDFALDYIYAKLLGHRFELKGMVDIVNAANEYVEIKYEGFVLDFSVTLLRNALRRFITSFSTRNYRAYFPILRKILDGFVVAENLLKLQSQAPLMKLDLAQLNKFLSAPLLILPAASQGHAIGFIRYQNWLAKIDRGENGLKEGSVNIYQITKPDKFNVTFLEQFLFKKQPREFFHQEINQHLGLVTIGKIPLTLQIVGNCSWANIQAVIPVAYIMMTRDIAHEFSTADALSLYDNWQAWDQDRALDEYIQRFEVVDNLRKATYADILGAVLFQTCDASITTHLARAEKILKILNTPEYEYILQSYYQVYCAKRLTMLGNNLLKNLELFGIDPGLDVHPIATGLKKRK